MCPSKTDQNVKSLPSVRQSMEGFVEGDRHGRTLRLDCTSFSWMLALILAVAVAWFSDPISRSGRLANLTVSHGGFPKSYLMLSKMQKGRCYLVGRRESTIRRSQKKLNGKLWDVERFGDVSEPGIPDHWLLRSEENGTVFFVPVDAVDREPSRPHVYPSRQGI